MSNAALTIEEKCINTIRFLSVDAVQKANSGHPGMPMGCAPIAFLLYSKMMKHNPSNPLWWNRDRFILSAGHGSMLLYSSLFLSGYEITLDDLKNFRQWGSITPGHPEYGITPGVETTTGPLGQGFANAVGMATAQKYLSSLFNKDNYKIFDNYIYALASDGDLMEGVSHEAASFAGHNKLGNLIVIYDNNNITIEGKLSLAMSEDTSKRFEAYGWHVLKVDDVNNLTKLEDAVKSAQKVTDKPSIIITDTHIGFGSPNKQDSADAHGAPLGTDEIKLSKKNLSWPEDKEFYVPEEVTKFFSKVIEGGKQEESKWQQMFDEYSKKYADDAKLLKLMMGKNYDEWKKHLPVFTDYAEKIATRSASGKVINSIAKFLPSLFGGSADLAGSNNTDIKGEQSFSAANYSGRNMHYGIREHAMGSIMNGMSLYGGVIPYGGTFLMFSEYMRPPIRLAALSHLQAVYVFTHDSIGLGEDGPTHQPIEQLASLRAIPNLAVIRPADANETVYAWQAALERRNSPTAIILSRQKLPVLDRQKYPSAENLDKGAYIIKDADSPDAILMASGSEVEIVLKASEELEKAGIPVRVVSFPSWELFEQQTPEYKAGVFPDTIKVRVSVEAGISMGWEKYLGANGKSISIEKFGASAPDNILFKEYGFSVENITNLVKSLL